MVNSPWNRIGGLRSVRSRFESRGVVVLLLGEREFEGLLHLFFLPSPQPISSRISCLYPHSSGWLPGCLYVRCRILQLERCNSNAEPIGFLARSLIADRNCRSATSFLNFRNSNGGCTTGLSRGSTGTNHGHEILSRPTNPGGRRDCPADQSRHRVRLMFVDHETCE